MQNHDIGARRTSLNSLLDDRRESRAEDRLPTTSLRSGLPTAEERALVEAERKRHRGRKASR